LEKLKIDLSGPLSQEHITQYKWLWNCIE